VNFKGSCDGSWDVSCNRSGNSAEVPTTGGMLEYAKLDPAMDQKHGLNMSLVSASAVLLAMGHKCEPASVLAIAAVRVPLMDPMMGSMWPARMMIFGLAPVTGLCNGF